MERLPRRERETAEEALAGFAEAVLEDVPELVRRPKQDRRLVWEASRTT